MNKIKLSLIKFILIIFKTMKKVTKIEESEKKKEKVSELICKNRFCKFKKVKQIKMSIRKEALSQPKALFL